MKRITLAVLATTGVLALTGCGQSYEEKTDACITAIKARAADDDTKPDACQDITDEDYSVIVLGNAIEDLGWIDDEGNVDRSEMIEDAIENQDGTP